MNDTKKTVCDTESYPPQTGDLLGAYVARLARTVVELDAERKAKSEEPSAYQRSLEARVRDLRSLEARVRDIENKLDEMDANENTMFERLNDVQEDVDYWFNNDVENRVIAFEARIERLETKQAEAAKVLAEQFGAAAQAAKPDFWERLSASDRTTVRAEEKRIADSMNVPPVCATCGHDMDSHRRDGLRNGHKRKRWCDGGTLGKPCKCREYKPVA